MLKNWLTWQTIQGLVRGGTQLLAGTLVTSGALSAEQGQLLTGLALSAAAFIWSVVESRTSAAAKETVKAVALAPDDVGKAVVDAAVSAPEVKAGPVIEALKKVRQKIDGR